MANVKTTVGSVSVIGAAIAFILPFIQQHEGITLKPKVDVGTTLSICYGHDGVSHGETYTVKQCNDLLIKDATNTTNAILKVTPNLAYHKNQLAATIDFGYNVGVEAYAKGSVARDFKAGRFKAGCKAMLRYTHVKGKFNQGLSNRRHDEYNICMKGL